MGGGHLLRSLPLMEGSLMKPRSRLTLIVALVSGVLVSQAWLLAQASRTAEAQLKAAQNTEEVKGDLKAAIEQYKKLAQGTDRAVAAKALVRMAASYEKLGLDDARSAYERVVREFADETSSAAAARTRLAAMQTASVAGQTTRLIWSDRRLSTGEPGPISADGRYLTFLDRIQPPPSALGLAIVDLKSGKTKTFSLDKGEWIEGSAMSPDGRQVAYVLVTRDGQQYELHVRQVNGGEAAKGRRVYVNPGGHNMYLYGWSPDGKKILVSRGGPEDQTPGLTVVSIADGGIRVLPRGSYARIPFSPDSRLVAFWRSNTGIATDGLFVATMDGKETRIDVGPGQNRWPVWSRDSSHILFENNRTGTWSLWMAPVAGGTPSGPARLVKENLGPYRPLGFTREGAFYYLGGRGTTTVYTAELDARLNATTAPAMVTNQYINSNRAGVWSPDGQNLAYISVTERGVFIRVRTVHTNEDREVPSRIPISGPVRWFPDGQSMLVASRDARVLDGQLGYYRVNVASGDAQLLHQTASRDVMSTRPDLSPDGKTIFYLESPGQPVRFDIDSRRETRLTPVGSPAQNEFRQPLSLAVSPDGAQVAYVGPASLVVAPAVGGEPREVVRLPGNSNARERAEGLGLAWSPDQRYLFFVRPGKEFTGIWRVPVAGGEPENIGVSMGRIRALRVHPDGRRIAFDSVVDALSEVWALENFLPKAGSER
jgi:Tol biopolymer transport system component